MAVLRLGPRLTKKVCGMLEAAKIICSTRQSAAKSLVGEWESRRNEELKFGAPLQPVADLPTVPTYLDKFSRRLLGNCAASKSSRDGCEYAAS